MSEPLHAVVHDARFPRRGRPRVESRILDDEVGLDLQTRTVLRRWARTGPASIAETWGEVREPTRPPLATLVDRGFVHRVSDVLDRPVVIVSPPRAGSTLLFERSALSRLTK